MNPPAPPPSDTTQQREWLSALADGRLEPLSPRDAPALWASDAQLRRAWHDYHLIGDVLRSQELAHEPARDEAFLQALRERLDAEPVVLAPRAHAPDAGVVKPLPRQRRWVLPMAAAAGVAAVAGVLAVLQVSNPGGAIDAPAPILAGAIDARTPSLAGSAVPAPGHAALEGAAASSPVVDGQLVRDARIDAYLRAHREARGPGSAAVPGGGVRNVDFLVPQR